MARMGPRTCQIEIEGAVDKVIPKGKVWGAVVDPEGWFGLIAGLSWWGLVVWLEKCGGWGRILGEKCERVYRGLARANSPRRRPAFALRIGAIRGVSGDISSL